MTHEIHEAANAFPMLDQAELSELAEDIKARGLLVPITLFDGKILDGRNRYHACEIAGVDPAFVTIEVDDPFMWVWSLNGERRHLASQEQKALIWRKLHGMSDAMQAKRAQVKAVGNAQRSESARVGVQTVPSPKKNHPSRKTEAEAAGVNMGAMARATALQNAAPELAAKVARGEMKFAEAKREHKRSETQKRIEAVAAEPKAATIEGPFDLVLADPPWRYDFQESKRREIENHYPTATVGDICGHTPNTAANSVLLLWATTPKLLEALTVMKAWGFTYKTQAVWDKEKIGTGYWFRGQHEILLVGVKGTASPPPATFRVSSVFREARTAHSKKPECVYEWIEKAFFDRKKLEMYCRSPREGWGVWGNEV